MDQSPVMFDTNTQKNSKNFITNMIVGSAIGSVTGVSITPKPTEITRQTVKASVAKVAEIAQGGKNMWTKVVMVFRTN